MTYFVLSDFKAHISPHPIDTANVQSFILFKSIVVGNGSMIIDSTVSGSSVLSASSDT